MPRRDLRTSPSVARLAATSARQREAKARQSARCMMQFVQAAETTARFLSSPVRIALYIAASASRNNKVKTNKGTGVMLVPFCFAMFAPTDAPFDKGGYR